MPESRYLPAYAPDMRGKYVVPRIGLSAFSCPHCGTLAPMHESAAFLHDPAADPDEQYAAASGLRITECWSCRQSSVWKKRVDRQAPTVETLQVFTDPASWWLLAYPILRTAPEPNADLPEDVLADYLEAADVTQISPRSAAALLRLCIQKLCAVLGAEGRNINADIKQLLAENKITPIVQKAMDTIRISGNESVHDGELRLGDDPELVASLFDFVNLVAHEAITQPRIVEEMLNRMPEDKLAQIKIRDGANS